MARLVIKNGCHQVKLAPKRVPGRWLWLFSLTLLLTTPGTVFGGVWFPWRQGVRYGDGLRGGCGQPSAMAFNPAGLTQLKATNLYGGVVAIIPSNTYESPSGQTERTDSQVFFPSYLYVCSDFGTGDFRFGVGLFSPLESGEGSGAIPG